MNETPLFLLQHGYLVIFVWAFLDQLGLPLPSIPMLLAAGALAGTGKLNPFAAIALGTAAAFLSDTFWYEIGRRRGHTVLSLVCRLSLEPGACVRRAENMFARQGKRSLLMSKFIPGLNVVAAPMAGIFKMSRTEFALFNVCGAGLWALCLVGLGYSFSSQLEKLSKLGLRLGNWLLVFIAAAFAAYIGFKYFRWQFFIRSLRIARITPEVLKQKLDGGEDVFIVDLRGPVDFETEPRMLPRAIQLTLEEMEHRHHEIPRDRDVVLYCTCPDEYTSARVALLLKRYGIERVRPLAGGREGWIGKGFPMISGNLVV